ncbi:uncharacterized protein LOC128882531 [Hylaeus volcanicus]|uniref:uncharacterized protein LOC128882531 n=1 Tax=Hylaeus volcanicus TaxID=313075 RepID=UPI0023B819EC|nr:uncharacterized protein LOC128882531 [Hylaeus volcanicus]
MRITVTDTYIGKTLQFDICDDFEFSSFQALVQTEFSTPPNDQQFMYEGDLLHYTPSSTLKSLKLKNDSVLILTHDPLDNKTNPAATDNSSQLMSLLKLLNQQHVNQLSGSASQTTQNTLTTSPLDSGHLQTLNSMHSTMTKLLSDPLNPQGQELLLKAIQQERIDEALTHAQEYLPESFASVNMLYVTIHLNGVKVNALVDSGAQMTIISESCAERCSLTRLIDKRFQGLASGVGTSSILGRIHLAQIKIGNIFLPISLIVVENSKTDLLFGLDLLRRYECVIDLRHRSLQISQETVEFLTEAELVKEGLRDIPLTTST